MMYVPELTYNLMSVLKAVDKGISFTFKESECIIKDVNQKLITTASKVGSLYHVACTKPRNHVCSVTKEKIAPQKRIYGIIDMATWERKAFTI